MTDRPADRPVGRRVSRWGWVALAAFAGLQFLITALAGAWTIGLAVRDGGRWEVLLALVPVAFGLLFWRWIALGAWLRANPPIDPDSGQPVHEPEEVGPWGVVGRVLLGLMVVGFVALAVLAATVDRQATDEAEQVRDRAERVARRKGLTVADVADAVDDRTIWAFRPQGSPDPFEELLAVPGALVVDASTSGDGAAILLEPEDSPPCVVVTIDRNELIRSRLTGDCR